MANLMLSVIWMLFFYLSAGQETRPIIYEVLEDSPAFTFVGNIAISSHMMQKYNDSSILNSLQFKFLAKPDQEEQYFTIEETTGIIRTAKAIDRDAMCPGLSNCHIAIDVAIVKPIEYFQVIEVQINILDINDNAPQFPHDEFPVRFSEAAQPGSSVSLPIALDIDSPQHGVKFYRMLTRSNEFDLRAATDINGLGDLRLVLKSELDREQVDAYEVKVAAIDGGSAPKTGTMTIAITVEDSNDHRPTFKNYPYEVSIREDHLINRTFYTVSAEDKDSGANGKVTYAFSPRTTTLLGDTFGIVPDTGGLYLKKPLDYEKDTEYQLEIIARDDGPDSLSAQTSVAIKVLDVNDYAPHVTINTLTNSDISQIPEGSKVGSFVAHISVLDLDHGENGRVTCSFRPTRNSDAFHLNELQKNQYKIVTATVLDREVMDLFMLNIECRDNGEPRLTGGKNLTVLVKDINDHTPTFAKATYTASVPENNNRDSFIVHVNASDGDAGPNSQLNFDILEYDVRPYVYIQQSTGIVRASDVLDHEKVEKLEFTVIVTDQGDPPRSNSVPVAITILDKNDEAPMFEANEYSFRVRENGPNVTFVGQVKATDADSPPFNTLEYRLMENQSPGYFTIDARTGEMKTRRSLDRERQETYYLTVVAVDQEDESLSSSVTVTVTVEDANDNTPVIEYPTNGNNTVRISNQVPVGFNVLRVRAEDRDSGANRRLHYQIMSRSREQPFVINSTTGMIVTRTDMKSIEMETIPITVFIRDGGSPSKSVMLDITIVVDASLPFNTDNSSLGGTNLTIIIIVASVSGFIMVVLIIAIALMKIYDRRKAPQHVYKCRVEEQKILAKAKLAEKEKEKKQKNGSNKKNSKKQNVSFSMDECGDKRRETTQNDLNQSYGEGCHYPGKMTNVSQEHAAPTFDSFQDPGRRQQTQDRQLESHLLNLLKEDHDAESASSTEMSNTDSGRGPSEEGDHHSRHGAHLVDHGLAARTNSRSNLIRPCTPRSQPDGGRSNPANPSQRQSWGPHNGKGVPPPPAPAGIGNRGYSTPNSAAARSNPSLRSSVLSRAASGGYHGDHSDPHRQYPLEGTRAQHNRQSPTPLRTFMPPPENNGRHDNSNLHINKMENNFHGNPSNNKYGGGHPLAPQRQRSLGDGAPKPESSAEFDESRASGERQNVDPNAMCEEIDNLFFKGVIV